MLYDLNDGSYEWAQYNTSYHVEVHADSQKNESRGASHQYEDQLLVLKETEKAHEKYHDSSVSIHVRTLQRELV